ncbi:Nonspecific acid phosphatase [Neorhizobium galegae bv. orientalis]|nr:Nonspecific acid phosphatase [Neorhizobium galegae bv. orientalis]
MLMTRRTVDAVLASLLVALVLLLSGAGSTRAQEPMPSWNDTAARARIMQFVKSAITEGNDGYVAPEDRIAVFDNDGTLWSEQPYYFQLAYMLDRVRVLAPQHPEWKTKEPFKSILSGDLAGLGRGGEKGIIELAMATHAGMTTDQFNNIVTKWFEESKHPRFDRSFDQITFLPMRELLDYLRANGFKTYIVSGGGIEFMRPIVAKAYGIPPEQVVGSSILTEYAIVGDVPVLRRLPKIDFVDDGPGKPAGINKFIGRRPVFAAGNSDGDYEMLRWVAAGKGPGFAMIVHHTDATREYAYDRQSAFGKLDRALDEAQRRNWLVVDMKNDWKKVFAFER